MSPFPRGSLDADRPWQPAQQLEQPLEDPADEEIRDGAWAAISHCSETGAVLHWPVVMLVKVVKEPGHTEQRVNWRAELVAAESEKDEEDHMDGRWPERGLWCSEHTAELLPAKAANRSRTGAVTGHIRSGVGAAVIVEDLEDAAAGGA